MMDMLLRTLGQEIGHNLKYLLATIATSGLWYKDQSARDHIPAPSAIQFNFIMGADSKIARAKVNGHWFFDEHNMVCYDPDPRRRNTFRATVVVLTMNRYESFERLLEGLTASYYTAPSQDHTNDIRLVIRIDRPGHESEDFHRTVAISPQWLSKCRIPTRALLRSGGHPFRTLVGGTKLYLFWKTTLWCRLSFSATCVSNGCFIGITHF